MADANALLDVPPGVLAAGLAPHLGAEDLANLKAACRALRGTRRRPGVADVAAEAKLRRSERGERLARARKDDEGAIALLRFVERTSADAATTQLRAIAGEDVTVVLRLDDGAALGWGANDDGALPTTSVEGEEWPVLALPTPRYVAGAVGYARTALVDAAGILHVWGRSSGGHLGASREMVAARGVFGSGAFAAAARAYAARGPSRVGGFGSARVVSVAVGRLHMLAATDDGRCWSWGSNSSGQLGHGDQVKQGGALIGYATENEGRVDVPRVVQGLADVAVASVASCCFASAAVTADGIEDFSIAAVAVGRNHAIAIAIDGSVWAWGSNSHGQLGASLDMTRTVAWPMRVLAEHAPYGAAVAVAAGYHHTAVVVDDGTLLTCGDSSHGQLGRAGAEASFLPVDDTVVSSVACGARHTVVVHACGTVRSFGSDAKGQVSGGGVT